jgi:hypothetical protein
MSIDDTTAKERNQPTSKRAVSRVATPAVLARHLATYLFPLATVAEPHVKWFVPCSTSDNPIPLSVVLTSTFWLFAALFVALYDGTWSAAVVPLAIGTTVLAIVFLYLHGLAHALVRMGARSFRHAWGCHVALRRHE